jgi:hypothetical protein
MAWSDAFLKVLKDNDVRLVTTPRDPALIRNRFMKGLGVGHAGALD